MTTATANIFVVAHSVAIVAPHRLDLCGASAVRTLYHNMYSPFLLYSYYTIKHKFCQYLFQKITKQKLDVLRLNYEREKISLNSNDDTLDSTNHCPLDLHNRLDFERV
jgi:hypothetical protein